MRAVMRGLLGLIDSATGFLDAFDTDERMIFGGRPITAPVFDPKGIRPEILAMLEAMEISLVDGYGSPARATRRSAPE